METRESPGLCRNKPQQIVHPIVGANIISSANKAKNTVFGEIKWWLRIDLISQLLYYGGRCKNKGRSMIVATSLNYLSCQYAPPCRAEEGVLTPLKTEYHYLWSWLSEQLVIYCSCRAVPNELSNVTFTRVRWSLTFIIYLLTSDADLFLPSHIIFATIV